MVLVLVRHRLLTRLHKIRGTIFVLCSLQKQQLPLVKTIFTSTTSAATLTNARTIGGVSFNGSTNINLPGVNTTGNQNTSGNAATATKLASARTIGGVSFDGTGDIQLPGVGIEVYKV